MVARAGKIICMLKTENGGVRLESGIHSLDSQEAHAADREEEELWAPCSKSLHMAHGHEMRVLRRRRQARRERARRRRGRVVSPDRCVGSCLQLCDSSAVASSASLLARGSKRSVSVAFISREYRNNTHANTYTARPSLRRHVLDLPARPLVPAFGRHHSRCKSPTQRAWPCLIEDALAARLLEAR